MRVMIVGGGIAGLSAAYLLQKNGVEVTVLESRPEAGGRCKSIPWGGGWIDLAAEMMVSVDYELNALFAEIGLGPRMTPMDKPDCIGGNMEFTIFRDNRLHPYSLKNVFSLLTSGLLDISAKARLPVLLPTIVKHKFRNRGVRPEAYELWRTAWADDRSLGSWLTRLNPGMLTWFTEPFIDLFWGYRPDEISRAFFLNMVDCVSPRLSVITTDQGYGLFTRTLADRLPVITGARVTQVEAGPSPSVEWERNGETFREEADAVIVAAPGCFVNAMVRGLSAEKESFFNGVRYNPKEMVYFRLNRSFEPILPWRIFPKCIEPFFSAIACGPSQICPDVPYLRVNMKTDFVLRHMNETDDQVLDAMQSEFGRRFPEMAAAVEDRIIARWKCGIPQFYPGYIRALDRFRQLPPTPGIAFAGDYLTFSTTGGAYRSGRAAAEEVMSRYRTRA